MASGQMCFVPMPHAGVMVVGAREVRASSAQQLLTLLDGALAARCIGSYLLGRVLAGYQ